MKMRKTVGISLAAALCVSGCTAITRDLRHPGGYPGRLLDKRTFDASESKQIQLLRFTIILAMAGRMAGETANDSKDADAVADYLAATADEINYAAANIYPVGGADPCRVGPAPPVVPQDMAGRLNDAVEDAEAAAKAASQSAQTAAQSEQSVRAMLETQLVPPVPTPAPVDFGRCKGYYVNFEADVPLIEFRMMRLLFATLPRDNIRKFAEDVQKGNFLGGAWNAIKVVFVGVKGLHTASGTYRTGQEAFVANFKKCGPESRTTDFPAKYDESGWTVKDAVDCLGLSADSLLGPHPEIDVDDLPEKISVETFDAIMRVARTSCVRLPIGTADNSAEELTKARTRRRDLCAKVHFNPKRRPDTIEVS